MDKLVVDGDVLSLDHDSAVVDGTSEFLSEDESLESSLEKFLDVEGQDVIETIFGIRVEESKFKHSSEEGGAFELPTVVVLVEGEELSCSLSESGEGELGSPEFSLVFESVLAADFDFLVDSFFFEKFSGSSGGFRVVSVALRHATL